MRTCSLTGLLLALAACGGKEEGEPTEELCTGGVDEDEDGDIDCDDAECANDPACDEGAEETCGDGTDEDGDGLTDCDDEDCAGEPACAEPQEELCTGGVDEDADGDVDCDDADCTDDPACAEPADEVCTGGVDEDEDGDVDCDDADCAGDPACPAGGESCDGGLDEDADGLVDCYDPDCAADALCPAWSCGIFDEAPEGWILADGYRAVIVADSTDGLSQPVAVTFAGGDYGAFLYVADQASATIHQVDVNTGDVSAFVGPKSWPVATSLLTAIVYDVQGAVGAPRLFVADQGNDADQTSAVFTVTTDGAAEVFTQAPGPGLDDIYCLAFSPGEPYSAGLFVSGDTDGALVDWGLFDEAGAGADFSEVTGCETALFDPEGRFGGGLVAALPLGGGYAGDGSVTPIGPDGTAGAPLVTNLGGVHAITISSAAGAFGGDMLAARWDTGEILRITPDGDVATLASGLSLTNYDANILASSPSGSVLLVADRNASRLVCIEPLPE